MFLYICHEVKITLRCKGIDTLKIIYIIYTHIFMYTKLMSHEHRHKILHQNIKTSVQWKEIKANWGFNTMHSNFKANGEGGRGLEGEVFAVWPQGLYFRYPAYKFHCSKWGGKAWIQITDLPFSSTHVVGGHKLGSGRDGRGLCSSDVWQHSVGEGKESVALRGIKLWERRKVT